MTTAKQNATELLSKFDDSKRVVAKLMARENITVQIVDGAPTASFDTVRRVLTIPNWQSLTIDQFDHLIGHEVGHALFTDHEYLKSVMQHRSLMSFFNVVEDARIERKMKTAFPGLARVFYNSYKGFHDDGPLFKGTRTHLTNPKTGEDVPVAKMSLIDRINLFYKVGAFMTIPFSASERLWLARIDRCGDMETALRIARALRKLAKDKEEQEKKEAAKQEAPPTPTSQKKDEKTSASKSDSETEAPKDEKKKSTKSEPKKKDEEKKDAEPEPKKDEAAEPEDANAEGESSDDDSDKESDDADGDSGGDSKENDDESDNDESDSDSGDSDSDEDSDDEDEDESGSGGTSSDDEDADEDDASGSGEDSDENEDTDTDDGDGDSSDGDTERDTTSDSTSKTRKGGKGGAAASSGDEDESEWGDVDDSEDEDSDDDPVAETSDDAEDKLRQLAEEQAPGKYSQLRHVLIGALPDAVVRARTLSASAYNKSVEAAMLTCPPELNGKSRIDSVQKEWNEKYALTAKAMAAEFERKKSARAQQRAMVSKTGRLDMGKLHQYRFSEDLFLRSVALPKGQSHGIVMVIDASGSMGGVFANVLDQVLLFAHFAFNTKIPFEAYMFVDNLRGDDSDDKPEPTPPALTLTVPPGGALVGLVNTNTDRMQFQRQCRTVLTLQSVFSTNPFSNNEGYLFRSWLSSSIPYAYLGGTPLFSALLIAERHVERMKRTLRLDKMVFVTISDGEDGSGLRYIDQTFDRTTGALKPHEESIGRGGTGLVVRDTVTKKNHVLTEVSYDSYRKRNDYRMTTNGIITMILDVVKDRHNANCIYIYLTPSQRRRRRDKVTASYYDAFRALRRAGSEANPDSDVIEKELNEHGQYAMPKNVTIGDLGLILPTTSVELTEDEFETMDTSNMSQRRIAKEFTEAMTGRVSNRKFVNTVMPFIA